jgi:hypothetical protein
MTSVSFQCSQDRDKRTRKKRSSFRSFGRRRRRFKTASCRRSGRLSSAGSERSRRAVGIRESSRRITRIMAGKCRVPRHSKSTVSTRPGVWRRTGTFIDPDYFSESVLPLIKEATDGRVKRCHDLRHFYASMLTENGESVKCIQDQLGHASATTSLDTYGHLMPQARQKAAKRLERSVFGAKANVRILLEHSPESGQFGTLNKNQGASQPPLLSVIYEQCGG